MVDESRRLDCDEENQPLLTLKTHWYWNFGVGCKRVQHSAVRWLFNEIKPHQQVTETWRLNLTLIKIEPYNSKLPVNKNTSYDGFHCCCRQEYRAVARSDSRASALPQTSAFFWTISYNWMKTKQEGAALSAERWARLYKVTSIRVWLLVEEGGASCPAGEGGRTRFVSAPRPSGASPHLDFLFVVHSHSWTCSWRVRTMRMWQAG